jgi:hypothetical protein
MNDIRMSKLTLALSAFALFFLSFLMSGNGNALPQVFFQRYYPEQKALLLSITLLLSNVAAITGIWLSRRVHARRWLAAFMMLATSATAEALISSVTAIHFIACLVLIQFADNFLLNQIDHAAVARSGGLRGFNDGISNAARLLGMLSAPAFFTLFSDRPIVEGIVIAGLGAVAMAGCVLLFQGQSLAAKEKHAFEQLAVPDSSDWLVFAYATAVYSAMYLFAANTIYLLKDVFHIPAAETQGGSTIVTVFLSALIVNAAVAAVGRSSLGGIRPFALALPALALILASGLILAGIKPDFGLCLAAAAVIGGCYGVFLWQIRDYSSHAAKQGKTSLLSWFNNIGNISALFAFMLMSVLASSRVLEPGAYYDWLIRAILTLPCAGLILLFSAAVGARRQQSKPD